MILDICKFCFLYVLVLFAFSCGKFYQQQYSDLQSWQATQELNFNIQIDQIIAEISVLSIECSF